jgi:hypothetical protein
MRALMNCGEAACKCGIKEKSNSGTIQALAKEEAESNFRVTK